MIEANGAIFTHLDAICAKAGDPISNAAQVRWITTNAEDKDYLKRAVVTEFIRFGIRRVVARIDLRDRVLFATMGFQTEASIRGLVPVEINSGLFTLLISEFVPFPLRSAPEIRNIIEIGDARQGVSYTGHRALELETLFAPISIYEANPVSEEDTWRVFFRICVDECRNGESWIGEMLADSLDGLADLDLLNLPYRSLCRSIFDSDPGALYMALYRCLEATYASDSCKRVVQSLGLTITWEDLAQALDNDVGWHPKEADSLKAVLKYASKGDLEALMGGMNVALPKEDSNLVSAASKQIYALRNSLVHYRPGMKITDFDKVNWQVVCNAMAGAVCDLYYEIFTKLPNANDAVTLTEAAVLKI